MSIEFRHESWFENHHVLPSLTKYLQLQKIGLLINDVAGRRDVLHSSITADLWTERMRIWEQLGLKRFFLFIHEPDDTKAPEMTRSFIEKINSALDSKILFEVLEPERLIQSKLFT